MDRRPANQQYQHLADVIAQGDAPPLSERRCRYSTALLRAPTALNISVRPSEGVEVVILSAPLSPNSHSRAAEHTGRTGGGKHRFGWRRSFFFFLSLSLSACWLWKTHICGRESQSVGQFSLPSSLQATTSPSQLKRPEEGGLLFFFIFYFYFLFYS